MPYRDIRQFIARLDAAGELLEIDAEVDPDEELGAVCRKVLDEGGPALLFNNVKDYPYPVFTNMMGTKDRIALAMDVPLEQVGETFLGRSRSRPWPQARMTRSAPCKEVVIPEAELRLEDLVPPAVDNPGDGGAFLNYGLVVMKDPDSGRRNMGIYRLQLRPGNRTGLVQPHLARGHHPRQERSARRVHRSCSGHRRRPAAEPGLSGAGPEPG